MASIENRSRFLVTVKNCDHLTKTFAYTREKALKAYIAELQTNGYKPKLARTNDSYVVRVREAGHKTQCLVAATEQEAIDIKQRVEVERRKGLFVDYGKGRSVTFADLLTRYLREISPRHKGFEVEGYIINALLADAGLPRVDIAQAYAEHKLPHPSLAGKTFRKPSGTSVRMPSTASSFIRKSFADLLPDDFNEYIADRSQTVKASTVDREIDLFSATCTIAIDTWRIPIAKSPMDGILRPKYFNERDRRLKSDEEVRLLEAAFDDDANLAIERQLQDILLNVKEAVAKPTTKYARLKLRAEHLSQAVSSYQHVPWMETFIQFQLMTGARRSETLSLTWKNMDFANQTAFIAESKNGRPRKLALRLDLIALLQQLPRDNDAVFPMKVEALRKAWKRICDAAGLVGEHDLHIHDLRHEAISRVADAGAKLAGGFSLVDLQAFSGHRDTRMLLRYTHLCMPSLAKRLDEAFADKDMKKNYRGQRRLKKGAILTMAVVANAPPLPDALVEAQHSVADMPANVVPLRRRGTS